MFRGTRTLPDTRSVIRGLASHHQSQPLLPPLMLYRRILREHKHLPAIQREMGDEYVKNEFKLHQNIDNPLHIVGFLTSWQDYLTLIRIFQRGVWHFVLSASPRVLFCCPRVHSINNNSINHQYLLLQPQMTNGQSQWHLSIVICPLPPNIPAP